LLFALYSDLPLQDIPNISYVRDGKIIANASKSYKKGVDPLKKPLDFSLVNFKTYSERFKRIGNLKNVKVAGTFFTQRGCAYAGSKKCIFCSIEQINPYRPQELIEKDIVNLILEHDTDHIRISDGDFTINVKHMKSVEAAALNAHSLTGKNPTFYCFSRADEIDMNRIEVMKGINIVATFIGYESGSNEMLKSMHKFTTREQNINSTRLLSENNIDVVCGGLVIGAQNENNKTLSETISFAHELKKIGNVHSLVATPLIPLPGSPSFQLLIGKLRDNDPGKYENFIKQDDFNIESLVHLWNHYMCDVSVEQLIKVSDEIAESFNIGIRLLRFS